MEDPEHRRLSETIERLVQLSEVTDDGFVTVWDSLTIREQRMVVGGLAAMVSHLRAERGDPPDSVYGPQD